MPDIVRTGQQSAGEDAADARRILETIPALQGVPTITVVLVLQNVHC